MKLVKRSSSFHKKEFLTQKTFLEKENSLKKLLNDKGLWKIL